MKEKKLNSNLFYKFNFIILAYTIIIIATTFLLLDQGYKKIITKELQDFTKFINQAMIKSFSDESKEIIKALSVLTARYDYKSAILNNRSDEHLVSGKILAALPSFIKIIEYANKDGYIIASSEKRRNGQYMSLKELLLGKAITTFQISILYNSLAKINNNFYIPIAYKITDSKKSNIGYVILYADISEKIAELKEYLLLLLENSLLEQNASSQNSSKYFNVYIINSSGDAFGGKDEVLKNIKHIFGFNVKTLTQILSALSQGKANYNASNSNEIISLARITTSNWYLGIKIDYNNIFSTEFKNMRLVSLSIIFILVIIFILIMISTIKTLIISKIDKLNVVIPKVKNGDLTFKIESKGKDSISSTINLFGHFIENLKNVINSLQERVRLLKENGDHLFSEINKTHSTIKNSNQYIEKTQEEVEKQVEFISNTTGVIESLSKNISSLDNSIETQAASVEQSSSAIEEMIGGIQSITEITQKAAKSTEELKRFSDDGRKKQEEVITQIKEIFKNSTRLQEANSLISSIASQTNLLSMNAAIEASHAGEAGKGFAIVAEEIKDLAEQVTSQSESVASSINEIMDSITKTVNTSELTNKAFNQIFDSINLVVQVIEEINHTMQEQSIGSQEILKALNTMREITYEVKIGSNDMFRGNKEIISTFKLLGEINITVSNSMKGLKEEINKLVEAIERIKVLGTTNSSHISGISESTNQFKTK